MTVVKGYAVNAGLAAILGFLAAGWTGAAIGAGLLTALTAAPILLTRLWRGATPLLARFGRPVGALLGFAGKLLLLPAGLLASAVLLLVAVADGLLRPRLQPWLRHLAAATTLPGKAARFAGSLLEPRVLPWTLGNIALLLVMAVLALGIDFVFHLALLAVPLILIQLLMLAITGGEDPDASPTDEPS